MSSIEDIARMVDDSDEPWRRRLAEAFEKSGKSAREVSLKAGKGSGYLHSILKEKKDPTIENLMAVAEALNASLAYILFGFDVTPEDEKIILALKDSDKKDALKTLLRSAPQSAA